MATKGLRSLLSRIASKLRGKPKSPKLPPRLSPKQLGHGHRGTAAGNIKEPDLSVENVRKWADLTGEDVAGFLYDNEPLFVHSTNVAMAQFNRETNQMMVEFLDGSAYLYDNISDVEAEQFTKYGSKGDWVWTYLRVRGSKTAHRKPYRKIK